MPTLEQNNWLNKVLGIKAGVVPAPSGRASLPGASVNAGGEQGNTVGGTARADLEHKIADAEDRVDSALERYREAKVGAGSAKNVEDPGPKLEKIAAVVHQGAATAAAALKAGDLARAKKFADTIDGLATQAAQSATKYATAMDTAASQVSLADGPGGGRPTATASQVRNVKEAKGLRKPGSGSGRATPLYDRANAPGEDELPKSPAQPLDDHKKKPWWEEEIPDPPPPDDPKIVSKSDKTFDVAADDVAAFLAKANQQLGGTEAGHTEISLDTSPRFKDGHCVRAGVTVTTTITRPTWGGGHTASDDHKNAIKKAVQLIKEHEGRHRQAAIDVAKQVVADAVGKTQTEAQTIIDKIGEKNEKAQHDLDAKEGKISPVNNGKDVRLEAP